MVTTRLTPHFAARIDGVDIKAAWQTIDGKLGVVSGEQLISNLSSWSQATYGVALSVARLSATMSAAEIPSEVRDVVTAIEQGTPFEESE